jgi:DNA primase
MAKTYINSAKYEIVVTFKIKGIVDKHDIVGAIFGQSEGLLGEDLDLRELQKNGKIGRIEVKPVTHGGVTTGTLIIPSSMDMVETCILAALIEEVDKVGPCEARFVTKTIQDTRSKKREQIVERAKELLQRLMSEQIPETEEIVTQIRESVRKAELGEYGPERLPAGPHIDDADSLIVVEGRADVITLLKNNIKNVIALNGSKIPKTIVELSKRKSITAFIDGDRGGELILRKLTQLANVDYVARAPEGKEVEELTRKEIVMALRKKIPASEFLKALKTTSRRATPTTPSPSKQESPPVDVKELQGFAKHMSELEGTLNARILFKDGNTQDVSVRDLIKTLQDEKREVSAVLLDGIITQRLVEAAEKRGAAYVIGVKRGRITKRPKETQVLVASELT